MYPNENPSRAQLEREYRRKLYYQRLNAGAVEKENTANQSGSSVNMEFSVSKMRRLAPFAILIYVFFGLFVIGWIVTKSTTLVGGLDNSLRANNILSIDVPQGNKLYTFELAQAFSSKAPQ